MAATTKTLLAQFSKSNLSGSALSQADEMRKSINALVDDVEKARRILSLNTINASVGNVGGGEDDMFTFSVPASTLVTTGAAIRIRAWGRTANNANAKTLKVYFGATVILNVALTASIAGYWSVEAFVSRVSLNSQVAEAYVLEGPNSQTLAASKVARATQSGALATETNANTVKCTATATTDNDILQEGQIVELIPAAADLTGYKVNLKY